MNINKYNNIENYSILETIINSEKNMKIKGTLFEEFTYYLFKLHPNYKNFTTDIWLYNDIPQSIKTDLSLPNKDMGIDLLVKNNEDYYAIQCKYRMNRNKIITWKELSTFYGLAFGINNKIKGGFFVTNTHNLHKLANMSTKVIPIYGNFFDNWLDDHFFKNMKELINNITITKRQLPEARDYQKTIISKCVEYFKNNNKGYLEMICGSGKTLTAFWINKAMDNKLTLVLVPSLYLLSQFYKDWNYNDANLNFILVGSDTDIDEVNYQNNGIVLTTNPQIIKDKITEKTIIISTYQSSDKVIIALKDMTIDLCIFDEAHKTVGLVNKQFSIFLSDPIKIKKKMFMTATPKIYNCKNMDNIDEDILSMDNEEYYGKLIYKYNASTAINQGYLVDYNIVTMHTDNEYIKNIIKDNKYINFNFEDNESHYVACALMLLNGRNIHNHLITYHNSIKKTKLFKNLLESLINYFKYDIKVLQIDGSYSMSERCNIISDFINTKNVILVSAKVLNEGINIPIIDSVCFVDNRTSTIDIIQCIGRCLRLHKNKTLANIFVPILCDNMQVMENYSSYSNLIKILKSLSIVDEQIIEYFNGIENKSNINNKIKIINYVDNIIISQKVCIDEWSKSISYNIWKRVDSFSFRYEELKKWVLDNKRLPNRKDGDEKSLNYWCCDRRFDKKNNKLNDEKIKLLELIPEWYWLDNQKNIVIADFNTRYNDLKTFILNNSRYPIQNKKNYEEYSLALWCSSRKKDKKNGLLSNEKILELESLKDWKWYDENVVFIKEDFDVRYNNLLSWVNINGKLPKDNNDNTEETSLSKWACIQRGKYKNNILNENKIKKLEQIPNWYWKLEDPFEKRLDEILTFVNNNNRLPKSCSKDVKEKSIGTWYGDRKKKIKDNKNEVYLKLSVNPLIRENLDKFLENKLKGKITFDEYKDMLFKYSTLNNKTPSSKYEYNGIKLGQWYDNYKNQHIKNNFCEKYNILCKNQIVKINLDGFLINKKLPKQK